MPQEAEWSDKNIDFRARDSKLLRRVFINPLLRQPWLESSSSRNVTFSSAYLPDNLDFSSVRAASSELNGFCAQYLLFSSFAELVSDPYRGFLHFPNLVFFVF